MNQILFFSPLSSVVSSIRQNPLISFAKPPRSDLQTYKSGICMRRLFARRCCPAGQSNLYQLLIGLWGCISVAVATLCRCCESPTTAIPFSGCRTTLRPSNLRQACNLSYPSINTLSRLYQTLWTLPCLSSTNGIYHSRKDEAHHHRLLPVEQASWPAKGSVGRLWHRYWMMRSMTLAALGSSLCPKGRQRRISQVLWLAFKRVS